MRPRNTPFRPNVVGLTDVELDGVGTADLRYWLDFYFDEERSRAEVKAKGIDRHDMIRRLQAEINARFADRRAKKRARER
jgi:hypothetical protein